MGIPNQEFKEMITHELEYYTGMTYPVKASYMERVIKASIRLKDLHPNPKDEFCNPEIGPNTEIVRKYEKVFRDSKRVGLAPRISPVIVEKLSTGGYMILNGHHRWYAAKKQNLKKVPTSIVNPVHENDILAKLEGNCRKMCVSFDLDEVLICSDDHEPADRLAFPFSRLYPWRIRKDAGRMMTSLQSRGFDIWVYTGNYYDAGFIRRTLKAHHAKVDGVINGMNQKRDSQKVTSAFRKHYDVIVHVDTEKVLWTNPKTREFDSIDISSGSDWAESVAEAIRKKSEEFQKK